MMGDGLCPYGPWDAKPWDLAWRGGEANGFEYRTISYDIN